jgi:uncharacterized membrane protein
VPPTSPPGPDVRARDLDRAHGRTAGGRDAAPEQPPAGGTVPAEVRLRRRRAGRLMLLVLVPVALATVLGLVLLWPHGGPTRAEQAATAAVPADTTYPHARVVSVTPYDCTQAGGRPLTCGSAVVEVTDGENSGDFQQVDLPAAVYATGPEKGDSIVLARDAGGEGGPTYAFRDVARGTPVVVLSLAFVLLVALVARARGLVALGGLAVAVAVVSAFLLPALLHGAPPTRTALVAAAAIAFVLVPSRSRGAVRTATALLGTLAGLLLTGLLGAWAVTAARLTGFSSGQLPQLQQWDPTLDLSGLVTAAVLVAVLGALTDVTTAQAAAVWQLIEDEPELERWHLARRCLAAGRERLLAGLSTLLLAYAGAALPLVLLVEVSAEPLGTQLTGAAAAEVLIRTLVGAVALVLAVPVTTAVGILSATAAGTEAGAVPDRTMTALLGRFGR